MAERVREREEALPSGTVRVRETSTYGRAARSVATPRGMASRQRRRLVQQAGERREAAGQDVPQNLLAGGYSGEGSGNIFANLGGDLLDTITGLPSAAQFIGKGLVYGGSRGLLATSYPDEVRVVGRALREDYSTRWGPLFRGDLDEFRRQSALHPGFLALDVAGAWSVAGAGVRAGARVAGAPAVASRAITPGAARYRAPKVVELDLGSGSAIGASGVGTVKIEVKRRPYSANPLTRGIQRRYIEPYTQRIAESVEGIAQGRAGPLGSLSHAARFNRQAAKIGRDLRMGYDLELQRRTRLATTDMTDLIKQTGAKKLGPEQAALYLHVRDLLAVPGKSPVEARAAVVKTWKDGLDSLQRDKGVRGVQARKVIAATRDIPDDLLDLATAPPVFRAAVAEARRVSREGTQMRVEAGSLDAQTAAAAARRPAEIVHGGSRFDREAGEFTAPSRTDVGGEGTYFPDKPIERLKKGRAGEPGGAFGRLSPQDKIHRNHGFLVANGLIDPDPAHLVGAYQQAVVDALHPEFVRELVDRYAFRRPDDSLVAGRGAIARMEADPDNVVLVGRANLEKAAKLARETPDQELPGDILAGAGVIEGQGGLAALKDLPKARQGDLVALPKSLIDAVRQGWGGSGRAKIPIYDSGLQLWKRGILAFAPRWYINNLFGNTLQYGLLTGFDLRAIRDALRIEGLREAVPERVKGSTVVADTRSGERYRQGEVGPVRERFERASDKGMAFNQRLEQTIREAAYISRTRRGLKAEGVDTKSLRGQELVDAIDDAPAEVKAEALREVELFLGDYVRMTPFEQGVVRRVFPFYSWMRVVGRLMFSMPVQYPKRTAITALVSRVSAEAINPSDDILPLYERGQVNLPGGLSLRTNGLNPLFTHAKLASNVLGGEGVATSVGTLAGDLAPLGLQQGAQYISGRNFAGVPFSAPPGVGGSAVSFGQAPRRVNPSTGQEEEYRPTPSLFDMASQAVPGGSMIQGVARTALAGTERPYDTTSTLDLIRYRVAGGDRSPLFRPPSPNARTLTPFPYVSGLLGLAGANLQRRDRQAEVDRYQRNQFYGARAVADAERAKAKLRARFGEGS